MSVRVTIASSTTMKQAQNGVIAYRFKGKRFDYCGAEGGIVAFSESSYANILLF